MSSKATLSLLRNLRPGDRYPDFKLPLLALGLLLAASAVVAMVLADGWGAVPITDFGRDLIGARAAQLGINPYQRIGDLIAVIPEMTMPVETYEQWVAHSPLSLALARIWLALVGPELALPGAVVVQHISLAILLAVVFLIGRSRWSIWHGTALASAVAMTHGFLNDAAWLQGGALIALGLFPVFALERSGHRRLALVILGILIAWRPWLAPIAFVLPNSESAIRDGVTAATTAVLVTMFAGLFVGGPDAMSAWLFEALPENMATYGSFQWNQSLTAAFDSPLLSISVYVAAIIALVCFRPRLPVDHWLVAGVAIVLLLTSLVWSQYWLAFIPILLLTLPSRSFGLLLVALLIMSLPLSDSSLTARVTSVVAVLLLVLSISSRWSFETPERLEA